MHIVLHKIEAFIDRLVPPILVAFLILIIGELFFTHQLEAYKEYADLFDGFVVLVFAADLGFKYHRVRKLPTFLKKYWLEIIATLPFFLLFRMFDLLLPAELVQRGQAIAHEGVAVEKIEREAAAIVKEAGRAGEVSRTAKLLNTFRALSRFPKLLRALPFYEKPTGRHHWYEKRKSGQPQQHF